MGDSNAIVVLGGSVGPLPPLLPWRGSFVIPDALPGIPLGDRRRIWTPAFGCYDAHWQQEIIRVYQEHSYTHFVYNCAGQIYHNDYGYLPDDPARVRRDLLTLRAGGLIPVVCACDDADGGSVTPWRSFTANVDLIPIGFYMWEQNGPQGVAVRQEDGSYAGPITDCVRSCYAAGPHVKWYFHFTAGHGAPGYPEERASWVWFRDNFHVAGLLSQDAGYDRNSETGDPVGTGAGLQDTAERLGTLGLENVRFEQVTYPVYNHWQGWDADHQIEYGDEIGLLAPSTVGFCDGGS